MRPNSVRNVELRYTEDDVELSCWFNFKSHCLIHRQPFINKHRLQFMTSTCQQTHRLRHVTADNPAILTWKANRWYSSMHGTSNKFPNEWLINACVHRMTPHSAIPNSSVKQNGLLQHALNCLNLSCHIANGKPFWMQMNQGYDY